MHETALPMVSMLHACLAIHRRCKFLFFLRGQTSTCADRTISEKSIKHCKIQCKNNIFHIHTKKMQLASGEPSAFTLYIYIYVYTYIYIYVVSGVAPLLSPPGSTCSAQLFLHCQLRFLVGRPRPLICKATLSLM